MIGVSDVRFNDELNLYRFLPRLVAIQIRARFITIKPMCSTTSLSSLPWFVCFNFSFDIGLFDVCLELTSLR